MVAVLTDKDLQGTGLTPDDLRREVAVWLFAEDRLTLGRAARLAQLSQAAMMRLLNQRDISLHYGAEDFEKDMRTLDDLRAAS